MTATVNDTRKAELLSTTVEHIEYITRLVLEICGGNAGPVEDTVARLPPRKTLRMRVARACKVIGMSIDVEEMAAVFKRLGLPARFEGAGADAGNPYRGGGRRLGLRL